MKGTAKGLLVLLAACALALGGFAAGRQAARTDFVPRDEVRDSLFQYRRGVVNEEKAARAGGLLLDYLQHGTRASLVQAQDLYRTLTAVEERGTELSSLEWLCDYFLADAARRSALLKDRDGARLLSFFSPRGFAPLKSWIALQYGLGREGRRFAWRNERLLHLAEFLWWNGPERKAWERTDALVGALGLRQGERIADIGCGYGYHTFKFADAVGEKGCVYGVDIVKEHLDYLSEVVREEGIGNVMTILSSPADVTLQADTVDCAFMCSTYHTIYAFSPDAEREAFFATVRRALRRGGRLAIADNSPAVLDVKPFAGRRISKRLVVLQLSYCGFRLVRDCQVAPQRYVLIFRKS